MIFKLLILAIIWYILFMIGFNYLTYLNNTHEEKVILFAVIMIIWLIVILMVMPFIISIILGY